MAGLIPEDKIAEVKQASDIYQIISETVVLKQTGRNYQGLCPFHTEKTPSFSVNPEKQIFHCFGCGVGGNVISFVMRQQNISFPEAVRSLANRYGIQLPTGETSQVAKEKKTERERLFRITELAQQFFRSQYELLPGLSTAKKHIQHRGFTDDVVSAFGIGFVPDQWDALASFLLKHRVPVPLAQKAGLVSVSDKNNRVYDRFRNRVMFPVCNEEGSPIAFGGRVLSDQDQPKYLNSPESAIFYKGKTLFALHLAKKTARETARIFVVEGNFDAIAMHQHGYTNTVATMGTALTDTHVDILRRILGENGTAYIVFDSDMAGIAAAQRSIEIFERGLVQLRIVVLPENTDPDSFLFTHGTKAFDEEIEKALNPVHFLISRTIQQYGQSVEAKAKIITELLPVLSRLNDVVLRGLCVKTLSEELGVDEKAILERIRQESGGVRYAGNVTKSHIKSSHTASTLETQLFSMTITHPQKMAELITSENLSYIKSPLIRSILEQLSQATTSNDMALFAETLSEEEKQFFTAILMDPYPWPEDSEIDGQIKKIQAQFEDTVRQKHMRSLNENIKLAEEAQDQELLRKLLAEKQLLAKQTQAHRLSLLKRSL